MQRKRPPHSLRHKAEPYIWLAPSAILMAVFMLVPIGYVFYMSMSKVTKAGLIKDFNNFENFSAVLNNPTFALVLKNTIVWTIAVVGISTLLGFILALLLNNEFKGRKIARAIMVFPWATTLIIQACAWKFMLDTDYGALNTLLKSLGLISQNINWTPSPGAFFAWEIACGIFVTVPFVCFTTLSGLQSIDRTLYEAATVDGSSYWQQLVHITIPLVRPSLTVATVLNIIYVFNSFPIVYTITRGAPANRTDTIITLLYMRAFYDQQKGPATAMSVIGFVLLCIASGIYMVVSMRKEADV